MSVVVEGITKRFPRAEKPAVENAAFTAPGQTITALLGPSGSGKTTILRLIAGLETPDRGRITVGGEDFTSLPIRKRRVGLVFQQYALFAHMNVRENVAFGLRAQGWRRRDVASRVDELLELVQLTELAARYPGQLSGGQQQRVAFARALAPNPSLLLLDEPFAALDANVRQELRRWLTDLHAKTHVTTLLVTHDQEEALEVAEHVVVVHDGGVVQCGTPRAIYDHPASPFVASFVGAANRLEGRVEGGRATLGALSVAAPAGARDGARVEAFVRPHDVRIALPFEGASSASLAMITTSKRVGGTAKLELRLSSGESLAVELPAAEADALGVKAGDTVLIDIREAKLFAEDYST